MKEPEELEALKMEMWEELSLPGTVTNRPYIVHTTPPCVKYYNKFCQGNYPFLDHLS